MPHPLELFKYCPKCGSDKFVVNNDKSKKCKSCDFTYYFNPSAAVVAIIENQKGEILVARRAKEPAKGTLDLPGGFADLNETIEQSLIREVKEETNLDVTSFEFLFPFPTFTYTLHWKCTPWICSLSAQLKTHETLPHKMMLPNYFL